MPAFDGSDDFAWVGGPGEWLGVSVRLVEESVDGGLEIDDRPEDAALEASFGEFGEEALDGIEPGRRGWRVVEDEARMALEPGADLRMLVRGIVVEDDVDDLANRHLACVRRIEDPLSDPSVRFYPLATAPRNAHNVTFGVRIVLSSSFICIVFSGN